MAGMAALTRSADCVDDGGGPFVIVSLALLAAAASAATDALPPWPAPSDGSLVNDPAVVWGRLPNGLRYAILPNDTPPGRVSLRLLVEAGSMMEHDDQRGLAHFLEHMAFKGSTNSAARRPDQLPAACRTCVRRGHQRPDRLRQYDLPARSAAQRRGAGRRGAGHPERLSRPSAARPPSRSRPERGVILSEKRVRDTPNARSFEAMLDFLLPGSRYAAREPIGLEADHQDRTARALRRLLPRLVHARAQRGRGGRRRRSGRDRADDRGPIRRPHPARRRPGRAGLRRSEPSAASTRCCSAIRACRPPSPSTSSCRSIAGPTVWPRRSGSCASMLAGAMLERRLDSIGRQAGAPFAQAGVGASDLAPEATDRHVAAQARPRRTGAAHCRPASRNCAGRSTTASPTSSSASSSRSSQPAAGRSGECRDPGIARIWPVAR